MPQKHKKTAMATRFRGLLPIVVDIETSGLNPATDALLEIALVSIGMDENGRIFPKDTYGYHVDPFPGARIDPESLRINGIDPGYPLRFAIPELRALNEIFAIVDQLLIETKCKRAVLVGHNAWFDLAFLQAAIKRCELMRAPFHSFTSFDTATLGGVLLGETVLAKAMQKAGIAFDVNQAHSAIYDAEKTAELFCYMVNKIGLASHRL